MDGFGRFGRGVSEAKVDEQPNSDVSVGVSLACKSRSNNICIYIYIYIY
jgi:hypothetical protein